jgi:hypothetical protein
LTHDDQQNDRAAEKRCFRSSRFRLAWLVVSKVRKLAIISTANQGGRPRYRVVLRRLRMLAGGDRPKVLPMSPQ